MEIRAFAERILAAETLAGKLDPPAAPLVDTAPGPARVVLSPSRPPSLRFSRERLPIPRLTQLGDPRLRARSLHAFANHELMALELMAFALLAFPDAPRAFRRGVVRTLSDEQRHLCLYMARLDELGAPFGTLPVNDYFWKKANTFTTPLRYLAAVALTFEAGNLDHAQTYADAFAAAGDHASAALLRAVHQDEISHVRFGVRWLRRFKAKEASDWEAYVGALEFPLSPRRARGARFDAGARRSAGMSPEFIEAVSRA